jgi:hypothetical protein
VENIKMDLGEIGLRDMDCIGLAQDMNRWRTLVIKVMDLGFPIILGISSAAA